MTLNEPLSAREREILDVIYRLGQATATDVLAQMNEPPSRSAVRTFLRILEEKGHVRHKKIGREYVFTAKRSRQTVGYKAVIHVLDTFFGGSLADAVASYLSKPGQTLSNEELDKLNAILEHAKQTEDRKNGRSL